MRIHPISGSHHHDLHRHSPQHGDDRIPLLAGLHAGGIRVAAVCGCLLIAAAFVVPAAAAGFYATHDIVKHTMPSQTWQMVFSILGAAAVGIVAFVRITETKAFGAQ